MKNIINKITSILCILSCALLSFSSCQNDDDILEMGANQGEMRFQFHRITGWSLEELTTISSVKLTLECDGEVITLPSLQMGGTSDSIVSSAVFLNENTYKVIGYKAFDTNADLLFEASPTEDNEFVVTAGSADIFVMPLIVYDKLDPNNIINTLHAICLEALGEDRSTWPKTWTKEHELHEWENLEFEEYDDGTIAYIIGLTLDEKFAPMKKLSSSIVNLPTIESLIIRNNALEELPANFGQSGVKTLQIVNTNLSSLPESIERMDLWSIYLENNKFTEFPMVLTTQANIMDFTMLGEKIVSIPAEIANISNMRSLTITGSEITSIPDVFDTLFRIQDLILADNKNLSTLPASIKELNYGGTQNSYLRGIDISGCGFTTIPDEVITSKLISIDLSGNPITEVTKEQIEQMTSVETLRLDHLNLSAFPVLNMPKLMMLTLIDSGVTKDQIDISGLTNLVYLFTTQEEYDSAFRPNA